MRVNVLAAGRGSRLDYLTQEKPKCLINFKGKKLIEHNLERIRSFHSNENIWIVTGYKSEALLAYSKNIIFNPKWDTQNIGSSILIALEYHSDSDCLFIYSDIYYCSSALEEISHGQESAIVSVENWNRIWMNRFEDPITDVESYKVDVNGYVTEIGGKNPILNEIEGQFSGIFLITRIDWQRFRNNSTLNYNQIRTLDATQLLQKMIESGIRFKNISYTGEWAEIDTIRDITTQNL